MPKIPPRRIVLLPAGVAHTLAAFELAGHELGNGYLDITGRVDAATAPGDWYPVMTFAPDVVAGRPDQLLCDGDRSPTEPLRPGTIVRDSRTVSRRRKAPAPAYWLYDGKRWHTVLAVWPARRRVERPVSA